MFGVLLGVWVFGVWVTITLSHVVDILLSRLSFCVSSWDMNASKMRTVADEALAIQTVKASETVDKKNEDKQFDQVISWLSLSVAQRGLYSGTYTSEVLLSKVVKKLEDKGYTVVDLGEGLGSTISF